MEWGRLWLYSGTLASWAKMQVSPGRGKLNVGHSGACDLGGPVYLATGQSWNADPGDWGNREAVQLITLNRDQGGPGGVDPLRAWLIRTDTGQCPPSSLPALMEFQKMEPKWLKGSC